MKPSMYLYPTLYTLEGDGSDFRTGVLSGSYNQQDTYRSQDFQSLSGDWGAFNFLRPSRAKKILPVVGAGVALIPGGQAVGAGIVAAGAGMAVLHSTYKGGSGSPPSPGTGYTPNNPPPPPVEAKKPLPWVPISIGVAGIFAAIAMS